MMIKMPSVRLSLEHEKNHCKPIGVKALQWFWSFSQFYGEYKGRSPKERQQWLAQQHSDGE